MLNETIDGFRKDTYTVEEGLEFMYILYYSYNIVYRFVNL